MHEMTIASELIGQVLAAACEHGARRVEQIEVTVGGMLLVVPEALQAAFELVAEGTPAAGATLTIVEQPVTAACRHCGERFGTDAESFCCPACGRADVDIVAGKDIVFTSMVAEVEEEASAQ